MSVKINTKENNSLSRYLLKFEVQEDVIGVLDMKELWNHIKEAWGKK